MNEILLIVPFWGKLPGLFPFWLQSVKGNPNVDWLIVTDIDLPCVLPANVKLLEASFDTIFRRIQKLYDFKIKLNTFYKICDFRPAYGEIFHNECNGYKYYGWCDMDLIFGNIMKFLPTIDGRIDDSYDKILEHGHFTLLKNTDDMRHLYRKKTKGIVEYDHVFSETKNIGFDEDCWVVPGQGKGFMSLCRLMGLRIFSERVFADVIPARFGFTCWGDNQHEKQTIFVKEHNALYKLSILENNMLQKQEIMYVHLQKREMQQAPNLHADETLMLIPPAIINSLPKDYEQIITKIVPTGIRTWFCKGGNYTYKNLKYRLVRFIAALFQNHSL